MNRVYFFKLFELQNFQKLPLCWKMLLCTFSPRGLSTKWVKFGFSSFLSFMAFKSSHFSQKRSSGRITKWAKFTFLSFLSFIAFKNHHFCQKMSLSSFSPSGWFTKWAKFAFFKLQSFQKPPLLSKDVFEHIFTKRAAYKISKIWLFPVFQASELSKASTCVKIGLSVYFHQAGCLQNEQSLPFSSFSIFRTFKSLHFCQKMSLSIFTKRAAYKMSKFAFFEFFKPQTSELSKASTFVKRCLWVYFHQAGGLQNEQSFPSQAHQSIATIWSKNVLK